MNPKGLLVLIPPLCLLNRINFLIAGVFQVARKDNKEEELENNFERERSLILIPIDRLSIPHNMLNITSQLHISIFLLKKWKQRKRETR